MKTIPVLMSPILALILSSCGPSKPASPFQNLQLTNAHIVNGEDVEVGDNIGDGTVALYVSSTKGLIQFCTGTLINTKVVLTAGHCILDFAEMIEVEPAKLIQFIRVGFGTEKATGLETESIEFVAAQDFTVHPLYKPNTVNEAHAVPMYDLAVIHLQKDAPKAALVVPLLKSKASLKKGTKLVLAGFGLTDGVEQTTADRMRKVEVEIDNPNLTSAQFTYRVVDRRSACSGDSGGPAYLVRADGQLILAGVTSWGDNLCSEIGAYTSVPACSQWIAKTAGLTKSQSSEDLAEEEFTDL